METVMDKLNKIYETVIKHQGCICLVIKNPWTTSYDNLCASAGYGGTPATIEVCNEKWGNVVSVMVFPDLTFKEFQEQFKNDPQFREKYFDDPQSVRTQWIIDHKDLVYKKCLEILGLTETQALATPYTKTCEDDSTKPKPEPKPTPEPEPKPKPSPKPTPTPEPNNGNSSSNNNNNANNSNGKHPLKSKTIWFAISLLIASILTQYFHINVSPNQIMEVIAVIIAILRMLTKEPLKV